MLVLALFLRVFITYLIVKLVVCLGRFGICFLIVVIGSLCMRLMVGLMTRFIATQ